MSNMCIESTHEKRTSPPMCPGTHPSPQNSVDSTVPDCDIVQNLDGISEQKDVEVGLYLPSLSPTFVDITELSTAGTESEKTLTEASEYTLQNSSATGSVENAHYASIYDLPPLDSITTTGKLSKIQKRNGMLQFASLCYCIWLAGWNDGTTGPLLPRLQEHYNVGFSVVSMIFVGGCFGFITGAALNIWLNDRLGLGKILVLGSCCQLLGYAIIAPAPPFPLLICAYFIVGFGMSFQNAQANGFVGSLDKNMTTKLGVMHGSYGLGALTSPFASTYFSRFPDHRWAYQFIFSAVFATINVIAVILVFRFRRQEEVLLDAGQKSPTNSECNPQRHGNTYRQIFTLKCVPLLAAFAVIYIGVEVTFGGWSVTFVIHERGGGPSSGYISSGFFGGLTLGRVGLMWLNKMVGEHRVIILYSLIAIGLDLTVWLVPSIYENAVAVSLIGLVLGPMFPVFVSHMTHILPPHLLTACIGIITGIGVAGSAALPFITGVLASKFGIGALQPLMISMMVVMVLLWICVPTSVRRMESV
ncbi:Bypass of stop codon protein 6 [Psilocybe cubensis]|uniref:Bypass of stop codon protein 6 n=2 Tax=Psilocybe cubensis TaxID=181762 RepID=A0ACB8GTP7_PSICU|nr:Bypass of stop codon protein 6 [Psilocybe cubensis]KAH9478737.1 Bypass of stop codon protein 6 [Psilocybe cubensis]